MDVETLKNELNRCIGCKTKPCEKACPLGVSPHDFIALAKTGNYKDASKIIALKNPLPQTCGLVCPDTFCQKACIRGRIDKPIEIPCLQAQMIKLGGLEKLELPAKNGKKIAVVGGGPAGIGATFELIINGYEVTIFEKSDKLGGVARLIPEYRLPKEILDNEIARIVDNERVTVKLNTEIADFSVLKTEFDDVILALGEPVECKLNVAGDDVCVSYKEILGDCNSNLADLSLNKIAVVGGGEVALDCALSLKKQNPNLIVEMFVRRRKEDMRIMKKDHLELEAHNVIIRDLTSIIEIKNNNNVLDFVAIKNEINEEGKARSIAGSEFNLLGYSQVITALGSYFPKENKVEFLCAGDMAGNCGTVVQAIASGMKVARSIMEL